MGYMKRKLKVELFSSFDEENKAEHKRRVMMSIEERIQEFGILQERAWGKDWGRNPIVKKATYETAIG